MFTPSDGYREEELLEGGDMEGSGSDPATEALLS